MIERPPEERPLTVREDDVAALASVGFTNREIAERLGLSSTAVRGILGSVYRKLELRSRLELAARAAAARAVGELPWERS